jgi:hypothetical protein
MKKELVMITKKIKKIIQTQLILRGLLLFVVVSLSSCIKYYETIKTEFPQGSELEDKREVVANNLRSTVIYDQFSTVAIFNALRLSDEVRMAYVDIYTRKRGIEGEAKEALLKRQLEENKHWISFYLLADIRDKTYVSLSEKSSYWTPFLQLGDNVKVTPLSIKEVDIEPEYQFFFGTKFNLFKIAYLVKFPARDSMDTLYKTNDITTKFVLSSTKKTGELVWDDRAKEHDHELEKNKTGNRKKLSKNKKLRKDEDFYWI